MKRWKSVWLALALATLAAFAFAGCGQRQAQVKKVSVLFTESAEIWHRNGFALNEALEKDGFLVDLNFARTAEQQSEQLRRAAGEKPAAIIVGAVDPAPLADGLAAARAGGIPVIAFDRLLTGTENVDYYVAYDAREIGRTQARAIEAALRLKETAGADAIELFAGDPRDNNAHLFYAGAMEILQPYLDAGRLVVPSGETAFDRAVTAAWLPEGAEARMARLLESFYADGRALSAVLAPNDRLAGGIRRALEAQYRGAWPYLTGLDADPEAVRAIAAGRQGMTVDKPSAPLVRECLRLVRALGGGKAEAPSAAVHNGVKDVPALLCAPVRIDASNLESVSTAQ